jgi:surface antigen
MMRKVVARALEAGRIAAGDPRKQRVKLDGFDFDLLTGGRCQEFVRECFESALGWPARSWKYAAPSAKVALQRMTRDGFRVTGDPRAGDVIGHCSGTYGHIAIVVGDVGGKLTCAENTSSASRGNPRRAGTKLTPVADMGGITHVIRFCKERIDAEPEPAPALDTTNAWQFSARDESGDVLASGIATTWWDHPTRTGVPADKPGLIACSIPRGKCDATAGSPFAAYDIPDYSVVRVYYPKTGRVIYAPIIDEGPGFQATAGTGKPGSAMIDLTRAAKQALGFASDMTNDTVTIRILRDSAAAGRKLCK